MARKPLTRPVEGNATPFFSTGESVPHVRREVSRGLFDDGEQVVAPDYDEQVNFDRMMRENRSTWL